MSGAAAAGRAGRAGSAARDWRALPKVELHLHLEGAAPPGLIRALAAEQGLRLEGVFGPEGGYAWTDFASFLATYLRACSVLRGPSAYLRLAEAVLAESAAEGVVYTELFVAPALCGGGDPGAWVEHLAAIGEGIAAARARHGIEARIIATAIRNLGPEAAERDARIAAATAGDLVTGWGMGGEERHLEPADFARAFEIARGAGLGLTVHAGEVRGAESVRAALAALRPARIGHGVRAAEDPELVRRLAGEGIVLEVNPGSNVALGVVPDLARHPVAALDAAGVPVTVSTDDPPYFATTMSREYARLHAAFGWDAATFRRLNRIAIGAAFCDEATRGRILARLADGA